MSFIISTIKIIFLLGFLIFIHEGGHFLVAKLCKVKVNEFAIGFGPVIWKKQGVETKYALRLIPLGGFVSMEGEDEESESERSFDKASVLKRIAIVSAGAIVNIIFGILIFFMVLSISYRDISIGIEYTRVFLGSTFESIKMIFTGNVSINSFTGPIGISEAVASTSGILDYIYMMSIISVSLGVTNLLPIPALDGGKIVILLIEAIRRKPINKELELKIQLLGLSFLIVLAMYITYYDVLKLIN